MKNVTVIGIDLAKTCFHLHGEDAEGRRIFRRKLSGARMLDLLRSVPPCLVAMEACASAHYWGRQIKDLGHDARLIPPQHVKPYLKGNKDDWADAEAIAEAATRKKTRFVPIKSERHLDVQQLHRVRERLTQNRTQLINQARGFMLEHGIHTIRGPKAAKALMAGILAGEVTDGVTAALKAMIAELGHELAAMEERLVAIDAKIERFAAENDDCRRLMQIPGIGAVTATALWAATPDPRGLKNGRQYSALLGLVPKHSGTGGENRIMGISKRGDRYVRTLLVHGARAVLRIAAKRSDRRAVWAGEVMARRGWNRAAVALANKNARTAWALLRWGETYDAQRQVA